MSLFNVSYDATAHSSKPSGSYLERIKENISHKLHSVGLAELKPLIRRIAEHGYTFCPATFKDLGFYDSGATKDNFEQMQLFTLEFNSGISFEKIKKRADKYGIPILFAYETFGSRDDNQFVIGILNDVSVGIRTAEVTLDVLFTIFPETDPKCRDITQIYFGGNKPLLHFDDTVTLMSREAIIQSMINWLKDIHGDPDYRKYVQQFVKDNNISLSKDNYIVKLLRENLPFVPLEEDKKVIKSVRNMSFRISLDNVPYTAKPNGYEVGNINNRIGSSGIVAGQDNIKGIVHTIADRGHTFSPATFKNGKRNIENFEQMQLFTLDFDGSISFDEVKGRAENYDLPILLAYETFNCMNQDKFRVCFLNDIPICNPKVANIMLKALLMIFSEADKKCVDVAHMFFGGKNLIYFDELLPIINIESLIRNMTNYLKDRYGKNYSRYVERFSKDTGVAFTSSKVLDVTTVEEIPESVSSESVPNTTDANQNDLNEKNLQNSFILYIKGFCKNFSNSNNRYYRINFGSHNNSSGINPSLGQKNFVKPTRNLSEVINDVRSICQLFCEFENGTRILEYDELLGLAMTLVHIDTGAALFQDILRKYSYYNDREQRYDKWKNDLQHLKRYKESSGYKPMSCMNFCPHFKSCQHGTNIISTAKAKYHSVQQLANSTDEKLYPINVISDECREYLMKALEAKGAGIHVINSAVGSGKSTILMQYMKDNPDTKIIVAFSTNALKNEWYDKFITMGGFAVNSPSLAELKDRLPKAVWNHIDALYKSGKVQAVTPYIDEIISADKVDKACREILEKHRKDMTAFYNSNCHAFTTHSLLNTMDYWTLKKYDAVIFDEDPILNYMIPNQIEIPISELEKILSQLAPDDDLAKKIKSAVKAAATKEIFELPYMNTTYKAEYDEISTGIDISSFCNANVRIFYSKKKSDENTLLENCSNKNSIIFFKPFRLDERLKYIVMSATADEMIYKHCFGKNSRSENRVTFYQCSSAENVGTVNQYCEFSMSRTFIDKNPGVLEDLIKLSGYENIIGHKKYNLGEFYFGKSTGVNKFTGTNGIVIGTPRQPEWLYILFARSIGWKNLLEPDKVEKMRYQRVKHNGFLFWFTTFDNEFLRHVQFWQISSDLTQSIGRFRATRHSVQGNRMKE